MIRIFRVIFLLVLLSGCRTRSHHAAPPPRLNLASDSPFTAASFSGLPSYSIELRLQPGLTLFDGKAKVVFPVPENIKKLPELVFHLPPNSRMLQQGGSPNLEVTALKINGKEAQIEAVGSFIKAALPRPLNAGEEAVAELEFRGRVPQIDAPDTAFGGGIQDLLAMLSTTRETGNYGTYNYSSGILSLGHWYPVIPRMRGEVFDREEPSGIGDAANYQLANYRVSVTCPDNLKIAASGAKEREERSQGSKTVHYVGTALRDFTVSAGASLETAEENVDGATVTAYFLPEHREGGEKMLQHAAQALRYFNSQFGKYPYSKLDVVEAPLRGGAGGMEYSGMIVIAGSFFGLDEAAQKLFGDAGGDLRLVFSTAAEFVVAHEVAHQWWFGVVGSDQKKYPYIDEALTNYATVMYFENKYGADMAEKQRFLQLALNYQIYRMGGGQDRPVNLAAAAYRSPVQYGVIVYGKGALYFHHLRQALGQEAFTGLLRTYAKQNAFGMSDPEVLQSAVRAAAAGRHPSISGTEVDSLARHWLEETHGDEDIGRLDVLRLAAMVLGDKSAGGGKNDQMQQIFSLLQGPLKDFMSRVNK